MTTARKATGLDRRRAAGETKDQALRAAQVALRRSGGSFAGVPAAHPYFWAAFGLVGDWR